MVIVMMNIEGALGRWRQLKGRARGAWGRLMNDRTTQAAGAAEELAGVIQEKSAEAQQAAEAAPRKQRLKPAHQDRAEPQSTTPEREPPS
jgi:uncharacterized protein YjbJ (UPF0337 family)